MLSASHNPMPDNGIKFFARGGAKLDDAVEDAIEARMGEPGPRPTGAGVGRVRDDHALIETYVAHLVASLAGPVSLEGIKVVVDCANGAAHLTAPAAFEVQGAEVIRIHAEPGRAQHQRQLRLHPPGRPAGGRGRARGRPRHRSRRRRRPLPGGGRRRPDRRR